MHMGIVPFNVYLCLIFREMESLKVSGRRSGLAYSETKALELVMTSIPK